MCMFSIINIATRMMPITRLFKDMCIQIARCFKIFLLFLMALILYSVISLISSFLDLLTYLSSRHMVDSKL